MIYITDNLRISKLDDNCLQIEEYKDVFSKKTGSSTKQWKWVGYYGSLKSALVGVLRKQLFDTSEEKLKLEEIISRIDRAEREILNAISSLGNID